MSDMKRTQTQTQRNLDSLEAFRLWVESQPAGAVVGRAGKARLCPLANYLGRGAVVRTGSYELPNEFRLQALPPWAKEFVFLVDRQGMRYDGLITRDIALQLLFTAEHLGSTSSTD